MSIFSNYIPRRRSVKGSLSCLLCAPGNIALYNGATAAKSMQKHLDFVTAVQRSAIAAKHLYMNLFILVPMYA